MSTPSCLPQFLHRSCPSRDTTSQWWSKTMVMSLATEHTTQDSSKTSNLCSRFPIGLRDLSDLHHNPTSHSLPGPVSSLFLSKCKPPVNLLHPKSGSSENPSHILDDSWCRKAGSKRRYWGWTTYCPAGSKGPFRVVGMAQVVPSQSMFPTAKPWKYALVENGTPASVIGFRGLKSEEGHHIHGQWK